VYDGFPAHVLDMQIRERNKILALGKEVTRRESVLAALQQKLAEVRSCISCSGLCFLHTAHYLHTYSPKFCE
jgi:hypothetical protein